MDEKSQSLGIECHRFKKNREPSSGNIVCSNFYIAVQTHRFSLESNHSSCRLSSCHHRHRFVHQTDRLVVPSIRARSPSLRRAERHHAGLHRAGLRHVGLLHAERRHATRANVNRSSKFFLGRLILTSAPPCPPGLLSLSGLPSPCCACLGGIL